MVVDQIWSATKGFSTGHYMKLKVSRMGGGGGEEVEKRGLK